MNIRERIHTALNGEMPDQVPWSIYQAILPRGEEMELLLRELSPQGLMLCTSCATEADVRALLSNAETWTRKTP